MAYPMLARPIVIDATNNNFDLDSVTKTLTSGTYPNIGAIVDEICDLCSGKSLACSWTSTGKLAWTFDSAILNNFDAPLRDILGQLTTSMSGTSHTCSLTPQHAWFPGKVFADTNDWEADIRGYYRGEEAQSGMGAGLTTGDPVYRLDRKFDFVAGTLLRNSLATSTYEQERCLETFVKESRTVWGAVGQPSPAGFYYFPDHTDCLLTHPSAWWGDGSAEDLSLTVSGSTYVFCEFDEKYEPKTDPSIRGTRSGYFRVSLPIHTSYAAGGSSWAGA